MRTTPGVAAAALLGALLAPPTAHAAGPSADRRATCAERVSAVADGTVYGAGDCGGGATVLRRRPGSAWTSLGLAWPDQHVEAVAADETATFVVLSCTRDQKGCEAADPLGKDFSLGEVPHGGRPSALTPLGGTEFANDTATVAARGGRWWAAFTSTVRDRDVEGSGSQTIAWRKTFGGDAAGQVAAPAEPDGTRTSSYDPSLALTGTGAMLAFTSRADRTGAPQVLQLSTAGPDGHFATGPYAPAAGADAAYPDVAFSGGRGFVGWARDGHPALAFDRDGTTRRIDLPHRGTIGFHGLSVAASRGLVTVSTAENFPYRGRQTTRVYARALDAGGVLRTTTELTASGSAPAPVQGALGDSTAARGRATIVFSDGRRRTSASP